MMVISYQLAVSLTVARKVFLKWKSASMVAIGKKHNCAIPYRIPHGLSGVMIGNLKKVHIPLKSALMMEAAICKVWIHAAHVPMAQPVYMGCNPICPSWKTCKRLRQSLKSKADQN